MITARRARSSGGVTTVEGMRNAEEPWWVAALCRRPEHNPEAWFPDSTGTNAWKEPALSICRRCPIGPLKGPDGEPLPRTGVCFETALANRETYGIWGGVLFTSGELVSPGKDVMMVTSGGQPRH